MAVLPCSDVVRIDLRAGDADLLMLLSIAAAANGWPVVVALGPLHVKPGALLEFGGEMRAVAVRRAERSEYERLLHATGWRVPAPGEPWELWEVRGD